MEKGKSIGTEQNQQDQQGRIFLFILSAKRQTQMPYVPISDTGVEDI